MPSSRPDPWIVGLLAASLCVNVYLGVKLRRPGVEAAAVPTIQDGTLVPAIEVVNLAERRVQIEYGSTPVVLYVFREGCSWCERNWPNVITLVEKRAGEYRFVALSLGSDSPREYAAQKALNLPVYWQVQRDAIAAYGLSGTPQTIVVDRNGKVVRSVPGAYVGDAQTLVESYFNIKLPGLLTEKESYVPQITTLSRRVGATCLDKRGLTFEPGADWAEDGVLVRCSPSGRWTPVE